MKFEADELPEAMNLKVDEMSFLRGYSAQLTQASAIIEAG